MNYSTVENYIYKLDDENLILYDYLAHTNAY